MEKLSSHTETTKPFENGKQF